MDWLVVTVAICGSVISGLLSGTVVRAIGKLAEDKAALVSLNEITKTVEKIKNELLVISHKHNILFVEEKNAMIEYLIAFNNWFEYANDTANKTNDIVKIPEILLKEETLYQTFVTSNSKLELFLNLELIQPTHIINFNASQFHNIVKAFLKVYMYNEPRRLRYAGKVFEENVIGVETLDMTFDNAGNEIMINYEEELASVEKILKSSFDQYLDNHKLYNQELQSGKQEFIDKCRGYLDKSFNS